MKEIEVSHWTDIGKTFVLTSVAPRFHKLQFEKIDTPCWPERYRYKPVVNFALAHSGDCLFLKFDVREKFIRALSCENNTPVHKDSCVEFFVSLDNGIHYYNFEFNCIGTCKVGFGTKERATRKYLPDETVDQIIRQVVINRNGKYSKGLIEWEITVAIPVTVFFHHDLVSFNGRRVTANFYKCGDDLPEPHYIAWREVKSDTPDFHRPEFFGTIHFL